MIALLTIAVNLVGDALARSLGRSDARERRMTRRPLEARGLRVELRGRDADRRRRRPRRCAPGRVLGLVGESGSGKTTTALALLGYARPGHADRRGRRRRRGRAAAARRRARRAARCAAARSRTSPQDPSSALDPTVRIGRRGAGDARRPRRRRRRARRRTALGASGCPPTRRFRAALPARALGRPAAARRDRDRARVRAARSSSSTSRRPASTSSRRRACSPRSGASGASSASRSSTSRTTSPSSPRSPTRSP